MSHAIETDYNQSFLLPPRIEDWVPENHPARFIRDFVKRQNLKELGFRESPGTEGHPHYSNDMQLKIWLYGYFHKKRSSRALEAACYNDMGMIWLTTNNKPDHNTLWTFWRNNKKAIRNLFKEVTREACKSGLIGLILHAIDGTKIKADVCDNKGWHLSDIKKKLSELDIAVDEIMELIERAENVDESIYPLPDDYVKKMELMKRCEEIERINRKHLHPLDKDARMTKHGKGKSFCFNAQVVADDASGLIVAQDLVNDENDTEMLTPMIERVEENLGERAEETVADAGYYSPDQLLQAEVKGYDVMVNINKAIEPKNADKFHKSKFSYDEKKDKFICPCGKELCYEGTRKSREGKYLERVYRCKSFKDCPERWSCSKEKRGRKITLGPHYQAVVRQVEKQKMPEKKAQLSKRKCIVERAFAFIKEVMGFRRFTYRGLENVKTQWSLICTTHNLHKLFRLWKDKKFAFGG